MRFLEAAVKWRRLDGRRRWLWLRAATVLLVIGTGLRVCSFDRFRRLYHAVTAGKKGRRKTPQEAEAIVWAVQSAAWHLPMSLMCLPQALAVKYMLGNSEGVVMHIGVNKNPLDGLQFHAWVEYEGKMIIGELPVTYRPIWVWE